MVALFIYLFIIIPIALLTSAKDVFTDKVPAIAIVAILGMLGVSIRIYCIIFDY